MNGTSYGTSTSGKPSSAASSRSASGTSWWANPMPSPRPARPWPASSRTKVRCCPASSSAMPVVSSNSPPDSHGVGSSSSEMCTHRTAFSSPASPATRRTSRSRISSPSGSMPALSASEVEAVARLLEYRPQHGVDLLELLWPRDQRGRELHHRVAAVVGAADQPAAEHLRGEEAAQQPLLLVARERLLGLLVAHELDRAEVARPAHVADDREVAEALEHRLELGLVGLDVLDDALVGEDVEVGQRDGGGDGVAAEGDAVGERVRPLRVRLEDP